MSTRSYKRGVVDTLNAINVAMNKNASAKEFSAKEIENIKIKVEEYGKRFSDNFSNLCQYISEKERQAFYHVVPSFDIRDLEKEEKYVLVGVLYQLAMDKTNNFEQKHYIQQIQKYLNVTDHPTAIRIEIIGNIEDLSVQKAMYQVVIEYLALQDGEFYDETEFQTELLETFSLNKTLRNEISDKVELMIKIVGKKGISEKYDVVDPEAGIKERVGQERDNLLKMIDKLDNINIQLVIECMYELYEENLDVIHEKYSSKNNCKKAIVSELCKQYDSVKNIFNPYSSNAIDKKAYIELKEEVEPVLGEIRHFSQVLVDITKNETFNEIIEIANMEVYQKDLQETLHDQLSSSLFSIPTLEHYSNMLEFDREDFGWFNNWSCSYFPYGEIYDDAQSKVDMFAKYSNSIVVEKLTKKLKYKIEETIVRVFPDISSHIPERVKIKPIKFNKNKEM